MIIYLWVAIGGALGSTARYGASALITGWTGGDFPWATLAINVLGSFIIGAFAALTGPGGRFPASLDARVFVMVGICGGYTTFSSFSLQTLNLMNDGEWLYAGGNIVGSVALCLLFVWLGAIAAAAINQLKGA